MNAAITTKIYIIIYQKKDKYTLQETKVLLVSQFLLTIVSYL